MLKILLSLFESQLDKIADKINNENVRNENTSGSTTLLSKKLKNINSKNLIYSWNFGVIEKLIF